MYDFNGLIIPFKDEFLVTHMEGDRLVSHIDIRECAKRGLRIVPNDMTWHIDGSYDVHGLHHPWESLPSSYTGVACKLFQSGGFYDVPFVEIKASPAKVMQGHNVFGSENLEACFRSILSIVSSALPDFSKMLDFENFQVRRLDATYSIKLPNSDVLASVLESLSRVSNKYLRPSRQGEYESTIYFNKVSGNSNTGRTTSLAIYAKENEVDHQLQDLLKKKKIEKTERYDSVIEALSDDRLQYFSMSLLRFEARCRTRFFDKYQIPRLGKDLIEYVRGYEKQNGEGSFCRFIWSLSMRDLLDAIDGQKIQIIHDTKVKALLHKAFDTTRANGTVNTAKAVRLFGFYRRLTHESYAEVKRSMGTTGKSTFYASVQALREIGFSKFSLQNAHKKESLPLCNLLTFDFDNQRPDFYKEPPMVSPELEFGDFLSALGRNAPLPDSALSQSRILSEILKQFGLSDAYVNGLEAGRSVRLSGSLKLSLAMFPDGDIELVTHDVKLPDPDEVAQYREALERRRFAVAEFKSDRRSLHDARVSNAFARASFDAETGESHYDFTKGVQ